MMSVCWFCHWGWHPKVKAIFDEAVTIIGEAPLLFGPSHIVWEDENFNDAQWCLDHFNDRKWIYSKHELTIVRQSLERLIEIPAEWKTEPADYDGERPEKYPPPWRLHQCKTCKHWAKEENVCDVWASPCRVCESPHMSGDEITPATAVASDFHRSILTGPEFGCIHHEREESCQTY